MGDVRTGTGLHLMVDGYTAEVPCIDWVDQFVRDVVKQVELKIIAGPFCFALESYQEAWAIVAESHVAVKWFPNGLLLMDLFSCKSFDAESVVNLTVERFKLHHYQHREIQRIGVG